MKSNTEIIWPTFEVDKNDYIKSVTVSISETDDFDTRWSFWSKWNSCSDNYRILTRRFEFY